MKTSQTAISSFLYNVQFLWKWLLLFVLLTIFLINVRPTDANGIIYSVHIKTVNSLELAEQVAADLNQKGYDAFYRHMPSFEEGIQYRIFIGTYPSKTQALVTLNKLWNSDISDEYAIATLKEKTDFPNHNHLQKIKNVEPTTSATDQQTNLFKPISTPEKAPPIIVSIERENNNILEVFGSALKHYHDEQFEKAFALFNQISESIDNIDLLFWIGICESKVGNYNQAAEKLTLFLAKEPNTPQVMLELSAILFKQKKSHEALEELEKAKAFQPPSDMLQPIGHMKRLILEDEDRFSLFLDFLIKRKRLKHSGDNPDSAFQVRKPPREFYQIGSSSEQLLRSIQKLDPDNIAVSYYLGYIDIRKGRLEDGIREWKKYLSKAPENERTIHLSQQMTLLLLNHAAVYSVGTLQKNIQKSHIQKDKSIIISEFRNRCFASLTGMGKGLSAVIMDDLRKIDDIRITDRIMVHTMSRLMNPDLIQISDHQDAVALGQHLSSKYTVWGEFTDISENAFHIMATVTDSQQSDNNGKIDIKGTQGEFYLLEKRMVFGILESIGIHKKDLPPATIFSIEKPHTQNFDAFLSYSLGLEYLDKQQFEQARYAFQKAIQLDPNFSLAKKAFQSTPTDIYYCPFFEQSEIFLKGQ
jgi:tetratricopeptide (TPR) repeat protein